MTPMVSQLQNEAFRDFLGKKKKKTLKIALVIYGAKRLALLFYPAMACRPRKHKT